eukprot:4364880-Prymnesium_polylepis.1
MPRGAGSEMCGAFEGMIDSAAASCDACDDTATSVGAPAHSSCLPGAVGDICPGPTTGTQMSPEVRRCVRRCCWPAPSSASARVAKACTASCFAAIEIWLIGRRCPATLGGRGLSQPSARASERACSSSCG